MVDKNAFFKLSGGIIFAIGLFFVYAPEAQAAISCDIAGSRQSADRQHWDYDFCATSNNRAELEALTNVTVYCQENFGPFGTRLKSASCALTHYDKFTGTPLITQSGDTFLTCWTGYGLDRIISMFSVDIKRTDGSVACTTPNAVVETANVTWEEIFDRHLENITLLGLLPEGIDILQDSERAEQGGITCIGGGINTALGCFDTKNIGRAIGNILIVAIALGGGFALLLMAYGTFIITTSAGIPDKLNEGKNIITSAAGGLLFMILSVVLYQLIGVNILGLPGLQ